MGKVVNGWAAIVGVVLIAFLSGCGGGESTSAGLTKAEFLREARAVCEKGQDQHDKLLTAIFQELGPEGETVQAKEQAVVRLMQPYMQTTEELADLNIPKSEEAKVETIIRAREQAASKIMMDPKLAFSSAQPFAKVRDLAEAYGLRPCAS